MRELLILTIHLFITFAKLLRPGGVCDGVSVCWMFNHATAGQSLPKHGSTDHDPLFRFHRWRANLRVIEVEEIKTIPYVPVFHPFVERLIGTPTGVS